MKHCEGVTLLPRDNRAACANKLKAEANVIKDALRYLQIRWRARDRRSVSYMSFRTDGRTNTYLLGIVHYGRKFSEIFMRFQVTLCFFIDLYPHYLSYSVTPIVNFMTIFLNCSESWMKREQQTGSWTSSWTLRSHGLMLIRLLISCSNSN